ncbi:radical SAM protein [Pseudomonadota bacterium]
MITFGPVPSRRLGRSLGINNIPPKACSYSCVYCQVGPTQQQEIEPRAFYAPEEIQQAVEARVKAARQAGESIDYLTFVPDGEPTLDAGLAQAIELLRPLGIKIAIISNGALIWHPDVRQTLKQADWVSLKLDSVDEILWRRINRPHDELELDAILAGMLEFAGEYEGVLVTETMLVEGINTGDDATAKLAGFLHRLKPHTAYLSIPIRPPAERDVHVPDEERLNRIYQTISRRVPRVEYLTGYEGNAFASTGDPVADLLSITAVHPMREEAVQELLAKTKSSWAVIRKLIDEGRLWESTYEGRKFYIRRFHNQ